MDRCGGRGEFRRYNKGQGTWDKNIKMVDRSRRWEPSTGRCFFRPLYAPGYKLGLGWQKILELPQEFAATVADKVGQEIELRNRLGEKWSVVLASSDDIVFLERGWRDFVDSHKLEEFDLLVFRSIDNHFIVEVYSRLCREQLTSLVHFYKPLDPSNWIHRLVLPPGVSKTLAGKIGQEAKLENAFGEQWTVRFSSHHGEVAFERGWKEFANYHNLEGGDILVFKGFDNCSLFEVEVYNGRTHCQKARSRSLIRAHQQEEHGKGKRKIGTSFSHPNVDLGSPLKGVEQVSRNSRGKGVFSNKSTRSQPQETYYDSEEETESPRDPFGPVSCLAVTSGSKLVVFGLPPILNRKGVVKNCLLMDEESRCWPASYDVGTGILCSSWGEFAALNGVEAGDRYRFAADGEYRETYKISVLRST